MIQTDKIFALMAERKLTKYQLAKESGVPTSSLTDWSKGRVEPSAQAVQKLAEFFDVPIGYFYGEVQKHIETGAAVRIPVLGNVPAGIPLEAIEQIDGWEEIPAQWTTGGREYFALRVVGDSMTPEYIDREILIVRKCHTCDNGKDAVVMVNGYDATFKRVFFEHNGIRLHPLNPRYEDVFYTGPETKSLPVTIIGVVVQSRRDR